MIFEFVQTERVPIATHITVIDGKIIGNSSCKKFGVGWLRVFDHYYEVEMVHLAGVKIRIDEEQVGTIEEKFVPPAKKGFFVSGHTYYELKFRDEIYEVLDIGLGKNKHFYQFKKNEKTVGMIHKPDKVVNRLDCYTGYLENEKKLEVLLVWCLFLEAGPYYDLNVAGEGNITTRTAYHSLKIVKEMYDPSFIPRIKAMDGITD